MPRSGAGSSAFTHVVSRTTSVWYLLHWMQATVQTLEHSLQQIQAAVARERSQIPKVAGVHDEDASFRLRVGPPLQHAATGDGRQG